MHLGFSNKYYYEWYNNPKVNRLECFFSKVFKNDVYNYINFNREGHNIEVNYL